MKTVGFKKFGDPEVLEVMEFPDNEIGSDDIKIKIMHPQLIQLILFREVD